jgi:hypothetical protein
VWKKKWDGNAQEVKEMVNKNHVVSAMRNKVGQLGIQVACKFKAQMHKQKGKK